MELRSEFGHVKDVVKQAFKDIAGDVQKAIEAGLVSSEKPPDLDPFFDDFTRAKSAKELKEHLETRVL